MKKMTKCFFSINTLTETTNEVPALDKKNTKI